MVCGWCCVLVVFCMACSSHHFVHTKPPPLSPFPLPSPPHSSVSVCVEKGEDQKVDGVEWSVVCGMQHISHCAFIKPSPTPVCLWSFTIPFSLSNSFSSFLPSLFVWFVWTERVKDKCGTHHVKHTVHHIQSTPHSFHPITPLFNEHMVDWFVMHQNTFHPSMVVCPLLMHKPFPPHSCFAIPFHHSTHQPPLLFSFSLFPIPFPFTTLMPCHHSTLFHSIHVLIVMIEMNHERID